MGWDGVLLGETGSFEWGGVQLTDAIQNQIPQATRPQAAQGKISPMTCGQQNKTHTHTPMLTCDLSVRRLTAQPRPALSMLFTSLHCTHSLESGGRRGHRGRVVLDDLPAIGLLPEAEGEARVHLDVGSVGRLPHEGVVTRLDADVAVHAHLTGVQPRHAELGHAREEVLSFRRRGAKEPKRGSQDHAAAGLGM